jgi:glutathione S-transferase
MPLENLRIGYWNIRGLIESARLMLEYKGIPYKYEDYSVPVDADGTVRRFDSTWFTETKFTLGLDFPNLPYLIDDQVKMTQSNAILRYIARNTSLYGSSDKEAADIDMLCDCVMDLRNGFTGTSYLPKDSFNEKLPGYLEGVNTKLQQFETLLETRKWLAGKDLSFPDFHFWSMLDQHLLLESSILQKFPNVQRYYAEFLAIPQITAFVESDRCKGVPCNNVMASFKAARL